MSATKFDNNKLRLELVPTEAVEGVTRVLENGAEKYGDYNWRQGMTWSRLIGATLRHFFAFIRGIDLDEESGLPHLDHAICNLMFLSTYQKLQLGTDNRYKGDLGTEHDEVEQKHQQQKADVDAEVEEGSEVPSFLNKLRSKL